MKVPWLGAKRSGEKSSEFDMWKLLQSEFKKRDFAKQSSEFNLDIFQSDLSVQDFFPSNSW